MANKFDELHFTRYQEEGYSYIQTIPEVKRFLVTELFDEITKVKQQVLTDILILEFNVKAPKLMPHPRARLLENGLVKGHNLLWSGKLVDGVIQTIGFFGCRLQIVLNFRR
jgi:hypothetical protein